MRRLQALVAVKAVVAAAARRRLVGSIAKAMGRTEVTVGLTVVVVEAAEEAMRGLQLIQILSHFAQKSDSFGRLSSKVCRRLKVLCK